MGDDSEWLKLPTDEKVQHKVWKARLAGYKEATTLFQRIDDDKSPEFNKYAGLIKKFVTDTNVIAQEKALEAVIAFMENAAVAQRLAQEVTSGVVAKCLSVSKQGTKAAGKEIIMICIELEKQEVVEDCLIAGIENKNPKVVIGCIVCLREALRDFGNKIILIKPIIKFLPKLLEDRDKNVREETKQLVIEIYRWVGAAIKPKLVDFKPLQVAELEAEFEKLPNEKPQQARFLRSQQDLKEKLQERAAAIDAGEEVVEDDAGGEEVDPYELIEAVNIIPLIPKDFFEKVEAKKWQERREALEAVQKLAENPKIEPGEHGQLVRCLLKVVAKDTNVMLVTLGAKCMTSLAKGLRKQFSTYAHSCFPVIFDKFKEKKLTVVTALREFADAAFFSINLEVILEDLLPALDHKNPTIKAETVSFLARCFQRQTLASLPKKHLKAFCGSLLKTVNDTVLDVREASFLALGTAMKVVTEKNVAPFLVDVDSIKMQKIKDCCEKAELLNAKGEPRVAGGAKATAGSTQPKPVAKPADKAAAAKPKTGAPARSGAGPPKKAGGAPKSGKPAAKKPAAKVEEKVEKVLSDEAFLEKAEELLSAAGMAQLENSNWKERLEGMENFTKLVRGMSRDEIPCQVCVRAVCKKPGLKETNFQVMKARVELISYLAQNADFSKTTAEFCLSDLVEKVGDGKNGAAVQEAFSCIAEVTSLEFVSGEVVNKAFSGKNPKNQVESLIWLSKAITEFGMKIQVKQHLECLKKAFAATNPAVRTAAISVVSALYLYMGPQLRMFFEGEKPALLQQIDAEFEKVKGEKPTPPTRGVKAVEDDGGDAEEPDREDGKEEDIADLVPRNDIGEKFSMELLESLADKNWKVRGEGLQKISAILTEAKFITGNLGGLPEALKGRLGDANKILITTTIGICATLAVNMGRHCKQHIRIIGPALIGCFGDSKAQMRASAVGALNAWVDQTTLTPLVETETFSDALRLESPNMRQEVLGWLIERLPSHKPLPRDELRLCIPPLLACLEDRNVDVRKKAQEALVPFMIHVGYDSFLKATSKLKPASKDQIVQILEKAREGLPARPAKGKKVAAVAPDHIPMDEQDAAPPPKKKSPVAEQAESKATKGPGKTKAKPAAPASKKKKADEDTSATITVTETKEKRFKDEKGQKLLKWNFVDPRLEFVEQLKLQMEKNFSKGIMDQLFHHDFKQHIKAIEKLIKCMDDLQTEQVANLDVILKWFTLRFFDTNPSMLNKGLEYLTGMFSLLVDLDYHLHEIEANSFMPYLVIKVGENKDNVRRDVRALFKLTYKVYPASKMFQFISDGIKSKNFKARTECLEELGYLIETYGITICQPTPAVALKLIASQISNRDNGVRNAALNTIVVAYLILGDGVYKHIGVLNDKEQSYLDERIKRSSKSKAAPAASQPNNRPKTAPQQPQRSATQGQIQRPNTAVPKSASSNAIRKEFQLDVEADSAGLRENYTMPELLNHDNLDEILQDVQLPKIKARPPSPGPRFMNTADMANTVSFVISQVTNSDISICIQALAQIDEVLKDRDKVKVMIEHVAQLLVAMSMQFKMAYSTHMADHDISRDDIIRLYRCLLGTLLSLFHNSSLATQATKDILKELINNLVTMLLDNRLMELDDGPQIVRSVNVLVVKIVEKSDQTNVLCALIRLLQECAASETCSHNFLQLIMKCLWKIVRMLPDTIKELNLDRVLYDTHLFMKEFPLHTWKDRSNDMPLRTIKTILHSMAKLKGSKILSHLGSIDAGEVSEVKNYLQKVLRNEGTHHVEAEMNGTDDNRTRSASKTKRLSKSTHDMLTEIFKKIGSKENTKEGLQDLYDFKKKYPEADLDPFLKKSSHFFQNYIERGLKSIESEREGKSYSSQSSVTSDGVLTTSQPIADISVSGDYLIERAKAQTAKVGLESNNRVTGEADAAVNPVYYMERLRMLRAQCGLDSNVKTEDPPSEPVNREPGSPSPPLTIEDTAMSENKNTEESSKTDVSKATDVSKLKERLARIKQMANS